MDVAPELLTALKGTPPATITAEAVQFACGTRYPFGPNGCLNALEPMSPDVLQELEGMRHENPAAFPTIASTIFQKVDRVNTFAERKATTKDMPKDYFLSTELNFHYAMSKLNISGTESVLEVGAEHDMPFLQAFHARGCHAFATNIYYSFSDAQPPPPRWHVVMGDMNRLPYRDGAFDVVFASATTHHTPHLPTLMKELCRVVKPGGRLLVLNDPSHGVVKHAFNKLTSWGKKGGTRNELIHENEYSPLAYKSLATAEGLSLVESFFSVYYDEKLQAGNVKGVRFAALGTAVSLAWKVKPVRWFLSKAMLLPGQLLIGLEINMIFQKAH